MKPTRENIITALRSGLATREELQTHLRCEPQELNKPLANLTQHKLAERYLDDGKPAYRLTAKGKKWKPGVAAHGAEAELEDAVETQPPANSAETSAGAYTQADSVQLLNIIADIRAAVGDSTGRIMLGELAAHVGGLAKDAQELHAARKVISQHERLVAELANANALADKLQHLLDSKTHESEGLRAQLEAQHHTADVVPITAAHTCNGQCGDPEPDMDSVPLRELIEATATYLDDGQSITIHHTAVATVNAFGRAFVCNPPDACDLLDACATLMRAEAA